MDDEGRIDEAARLLAEELGDDFDAAFETKSDWTLARGGKPFRDINLPFRHDYRRAAVALLNFAGN